MKFVRCYMIALLAIPFYIGPEIAANVQINAERLLIAFIAGLLTLGVIRGLFLPGLKELMRERPFLMSMLAAYMLWRMVSGIVSPYPVSFYLFLNELMTTAFVFVLFYTAFFQRGDHKTVLGVLSFGVIWIFGVVVIEVTIGSNPFTPLAPVSAGQAITSATLERGGFLRVKGTFEHPLTLGHFVIMVLPIFLFIDGRHMSRRKALFLAFLLVSMGIATGGRLTMVLVAAQVGLYLLTRGLIFRTEGRSLNLGLVFLLLLPILGYLLVGSIEQRSGASMLSSYTRVAQIVNGLIAISDSAWFGFGDGPGGLQIIAEVVRHGEGSMLLWEANLSTIDNWFLSVLLSSGVPALLFFLAFQASVLGPGLALLFSRHARLVMEQRGDRGLFVGVLLGCLSGFGFMGILSIFTLHPLYFILAAWLTALLIQYRGVLRSMVVQPMLRCPNARPVE